MLPERDRHPGTTGGVKAASTLIDDGVRQKFRRATFAKCGKRRGLYFPLKRLGHSGCALRRVLTEERINKIRRLPTAARIDQKLPRPANQLGGILIRFDIRLLM